MAQPGDLTDDELRSLLADITPDEYAKLSGGERVRFDAIRASQHPPTPMGMVKDAASAAGSYVTENPRKVGAALGGIVAPALVTGGASLPVSVAASMLGGAGGSGLGMLYDATRQYFGGKPSAEALPSSATGVGSAMGGEAAAQGAADLTGRGVGAGLQFTGRTLMDAGVVGANKVLRRGFPGLADTLVREGVNPTSSRGLAKAERIREESAGVTRRLVQDAEASGAPPIARSDVEPYLDPSTRQASAQAKAGVGGGAGAITKRTDALFDAHFPHNTIPLTDAPAVTRVLQDEGEAVLNAKEKGQITNDMAATVSNDLANGVRQVTRKRVPGYEASNARTQGMIGASRLATDLSQAPLGIPLKPLLGAAGLAGVVGAGEYGRSNNPTNSLMAAGGALALGVPQISAQVAINLFKAGQLPYALLLKVIGPEVAHAAGITPP